MAGSAGEHSGQVAEEPDLPGGTWMKGRRLEIAVPEPLEFRVDEDYSGEPPALSEELGIPILREDLLEALHGAGVDNLEVFRAVVRDPANDCEYGNFLAFNIVGLVSATNWDESKTLDSNDSEAVDVDFASLVIDGAAAGDLKLFRLAEAVNAIVVHESVKDAVESAGIEGVEFYGPGEWMG